MRVFYSAGRVTVLVLLVSACAAPIASAPPSSTTTRAASTTATTTTTTILTTTTTEPSTPHFAGSISDVDIDRLAHSWHSQCPVEPADLRLLSVTYWSFEGQARTGEIIVHSDHAHGVLTVFESLFDAGYPIASIVPIGDLPEGAEHQPSYSNTSGFHCRPVYGGSKWSQHAFGLAIDLNPHLNPYVASDETWPTGSERYLDRTLGEPGMITEGDAVVAAFDSIDWHWGGRWNSISDYHHFSATGG